MYNFWHKLCGIAVRFRVVVRFPVYKARLLNVAIFDCSFNASLIRYYENIPGDKWATAFSITSLFAEGVWGDNGTPYIFLGFLILAFCIQINTDFEYLK